MRVECLEYALAEDLRDGVWGGTSPEERRAVARLRRAGETLDQLLDALDRPRPPARASQAARGDEKA